MIEKILTEIIAKFNGKAATDEKLKSELAGISRTILLKLDDGRSFHFSLSDGRASEPRSGHIEDPDIRIESDETTIVALYRREMRVMKALALKKLRVDSSMDDLLRLRKFF